MMLRRVAFICANESAPWGGSELLWSQAAEQMLKAGVAISIGVKAWDQEAKQIGRLEDLGCRVVRFADEPLAKRILRKFISPPPLFMKQVTELTADRPDLVVISQGNSNDGDRFMRACRSLGLRYVTITHAAAEQFWADDESAGGLAGHFAAAAANYFVSEANLRLVRRQFGIDLPRAKVARNPYGVSYDAIPVWPGDPTAHLSLACVGRLDLIAKGQDVLIDVLTEPTWRQRGVSLTLYGSGSNRRCIEGQIKKTGLSNITIAGQVEGVEKVWERHHAMLLASRYEGLPIAIVEAMLCGRACIASDVAGNGEVIRDGINGFLAQAPTPALMAEAMERAWHRRGELQAMGQVAAADIRALVPRDVITPFIRELESAAGGVLCG